jgi:hypothetical protein
MRVILMLLAAVLALGGCYQRVVGTRGLGAAGTRVHPEYRSDTAADRAVDGMLGRDRQGERYDARTYDEPR